MSVLRASAISLVSLAFAGFVVASPRPAWADEPPPADHVDHPDDHADHPADEHAEHADHPADDHAEHADAHHDEHADHAAAADDDADADAVDDDDVAEPADPAFKQEYAAAFANVPANIDDAGLEQRPADQQLVPSLTADQLRAMVRVARTKVLPRMQHKMEVKAAQRMSTISAMIRWFSLAGLLLLLAPLVLRKRYPNQGASLFKYSALAAVTFIVTVNLFGTVVLGFRSAQAKLGAATNPQLRVAAAFFDSLDDNAPEYLVMGKELFAPTLAQLQSSSDEQPAVVLIENGKKLVKDADVFISIAKVFKKVDFVFALLPTVLLLVTMVLFVIAIRPTLLEIVRLPMAVAAGQGDAGKTVVKRAMRRVVGELLATIATLGVLVGLSLFAGAILGRVVGPALDALIGYFTLGITYLQFVKGASSGLVFMMMLGVIVFLALNLGVVIVSMSLFLGKAQKIFQRRFNDGVPLREHARFWKWGVPAVVVAQIVPWIYLVIAEWGLDKLDDKLTSGVTDASQIPWSAIMLIGPACLVVGFAVFYWAARGLKAIKFLAGYKPGSVTTTSSET